MAQLCQEYDQFRAANTEILVIAPNRPASLARYVNAHPTPFSILSDPSAYVAGSYGIEVVHKAFLTLFVGASFVVDQAGRICYADYSMPLVGSVDESPALAVLAGMA